MPKSHVEQHTLVLKNITEQALVLQPYSKQKMCRPTPLSLHLIYTSSSSVSLQSLKEPFDCITCSKLYDTLHVMLRYISSDAVLSLLVTLVCMSAVQMTDMKLNPFVYTDVLNMP
jgi:hypothetical protein